MKLYVGNLSYRVSEDQFKDYFASFGEVLSAKIITDRFTGQSKGFGFVEFADKEAAEEAIKELNGSNFEGRSIVVNEAKPMEDRPPRRSKTRG
ncbi:putative RNA-binding protein rbpA [Waddlia chondrophila 2032/99]|uniref:RNA-binding protein n=2 Tax=Waddlia chondrophila TaxID=71667 RepID=D6YVC1_WADCW|nr:RNA-binding protein [Waddlia chondrophila]ADI38082.1 RNA-binding protein [Waddlia chondrophila WSU 86-1044]CCB91217.1 putative RNA-binding protein rbpA [Waddlia chondrophila 2032/99]